MGTYIILFLLLLICILICLLRIQAKKIYKLKHENEVLIDNNANLEDSKKKSMEVFEENLLYLQIVAGIVGEPLDWCNPSSKEYFFVEKLGDMKYLFLETKQENHSIGPIVVGVVTNRLPWDVALSCENFIELNSKFYNTAFFAKFAKTIRNKSEKPA